MIKTFCVYLHKTLNGEIFYIGSGTQRRASSLEKSRRKGRATRRGKKYTDYVESLGFNYAFEIIRYFDTKEEAIEFEILEYDRLLSSGIALMNHKRPSVVKDISIEDVVKYVFYDVNSPSCLSWRIDSGTTYPRVPGKMVGNMGDRGCYHCKISGKSYLVHRIIMELHGISTKGKVVDHLNGNPSDNRIENLRVCTNAENSRNKKRQNNNTSGTSGVIFHKSKNAWIAIFKVNESSVERSFSVRKYGFKQAKSLAIAARINFLIEAEKQGIVYSSRHGKLSETHNKPSQ